MNYRYCYIYIGTTFFSLNDIPAGLLYSTYSSRVEDIDVYELEGIKICKKIIDKCDEYIEDSVVNIGQSMENIKEIKYNKSILSYKGHFQYVFKQHLNQYFKQQPLD